MRKYIKEGTVFNKLTVVKRLPTEKKKNIKYLCKCECGNFKSVTGSNLFSGTKSCGCLFKSLRSGLAPVGRKFKYATILSKLSKKDYLASCSCGKEFQVKYYKIYKKSEDIHCGCRRKPRIAQHLSKTIYRQYIYNANKRKILFDIDYDTFKKLIESNCNYCGIEPQNHVIYTTNKNYSYDYNGIDRIDSNKGYLMDNIVSCCKFCNRAKKDEQLQVFIKWINFVQSKKLD